MDVMTDDFVFSGSMFNKFGEHYFDFRPVDNYLDSIPIDENKNNIGIYTRRQRRDKIKKFNKKKQNRTLGSKNKSCRSKFADSRPRVKGRFIKKVESNNIINIANCIISFESYKNLEKIRKEKEKEECARCYHCDKLFITKAFLQRHMLLNHF